MSTVATLLQEIEAFCRSAEMSESMFGKRVANDGKFVGRLRDGADLTVGMLDRARAFIRDQGAGVTSDRPTSTRKAAKSSKARAA